MSSGSRLRTTIATDHEIAAPRIPWSRDQHHVEPDVHGQRHGAVAQAQPAASRHQQHGVDGATRGGEQHRQRQDEHDVGGHVVALAEDPIRAGANPASTRYSGQAAIMLQSVAAW